MRDREPSATHTDGYSGPVLRKMRRRFSSGYAQARPVERTGFLAAGGFATTLTGARALNYLLERRRPSPVLRSVGRRLGRLPLSDSPRVHHYIAGLLLGFGAGGGALLTRDDPVGRRLSLPFGAGAALTVDELGVLLEQRDMAYWGTERLAVAEITAALACTAALAGRFMRAGDDDERQPV